MNRAANNKQKGFTIVELLVVMVITGILASVAYPAYSKFLVDGKATSAQTVIAALAAAQKSTRQMTGEFDVGTPPTGVAVGGWAGIDNDDGCYAIGPTLIDLGEAPDFQFQLINSDITTNTFKIRARGNGGGVDNSDTLLYSYNALGNPRAEWIAGGSFTAP